jgi:hypothetical protein
MKLNSLFLSLAISVILLLNMSESKSQEKIIWLNDFTAEITAGSNTYQYNFYTLGEECKLKIVEKKINKKGNESVQSNIFYLSDISPSSLNFKSSGKVLVINMETVQGQKFISRYNGDEFEAYTNNLSLITDEVDKARTMIDAFLSHIETCIDNSISWTGTDESFNWLEKNITESDKSGTVFKQKFRRGEKPHLAIFETETINSKGEQEMNRYVFDVTDIETNGIELVVSGTSLKINLPVKDKDNFIQNITGENEVRFIKDIDLYVDDIELARNLAAALKYLVTNTTVSRNEFPGYNEALDYVKKNLPKVTIGSDIYEQSISFEDTPDGLVSFRKIKTNKEGEAVEESFQLYLCDMKKEVQLNVSTGSVKLELETTDGEKYIKFYDDGQPGNYTNNIEIYVDRIDDARDLINAMEFAIGNSESGMKPFTGLNSTSDWLETNVTGIVIGSKQIQQNMAVITDEENKIELKIVTSSEGNEPVDETFEIYPRDIDLEDLNIRISGDEMFIPLSTGKLKFIKAYEDGELQNYGTKTEVHFEDIKTARNFIGAMSYLNKSSREKDWSFENENTAFTYIEDHLGKIDVSGDIYEQTIEKSDDNSCKLRYTVLKTDSKGTSVEHAYEFMAADLDIQNSEILVSGKEMTIRMITRDREKIVKPFENGEEENFTYSFELHTDDVLIAKKLLAAFDELAHACE